MASLTYRHREDTHLSPYSGAMTFRDKWRSKDRSHGVQSHSLASCVPWSPQLWLRSCRRGGTTWFPEGGGGPGCRVSKGHGPPRVGARVREEEVDKRPGVP